MVEFDSTVVQDSLDIRFGVCQTIASERQKIMEELKAILEQEIPEVEKLAQAFDWITSRIVEHGRLEVELARVMQDRESLVKEQIKLSVMEHARQIFQQCHVMVTGRRAWDD
jgi:hypothetical protein